MSGFVTHKAVCRIICFCGNFFMRFFSKLMRFFLAVIVYGRTDSKVADLNAVVDYCKEAGITNPKEQISLAEVHDCFTITELLISEDLGFSERGQGWKDFMDGMYDRDGKLPINIDGGLKSFGHPIGASGLRMIYEMWLQFHGLAGKRQRENVRLGMTHNMGGRPYCCVAGITICGMDLG